MARTDSLEHFLTDAAAAIRLKSGTSAQMNSNEMINNINSWTSDFVRDYVINEVIDEDNESDAGIEVAFFNSIPKAYFNYLMNTATNLSHAFYEFYALSNINNLIPSKPINNIYSCFYSCRNLISLDLSKWNLVNNLDFDSAFRFCSNLRTISLPNDIILYRPWGAFQNCENLIFLNGRNIKVYNSASLLFSSCKNLDFKCLENWNLCSTTSLEHAFTNSGLTNTNFFINKIFNTRNIADMFAGCKNLELDASLNFNFWNANDCSGLFRDCSKITSFMPQYFDIGQSNSLNWFFMNCSSLTSVSFDNMNLQNVQNLSYMFTNCNKLESVDGTIFTSPTVEIKNVYKMFSNCMNLNSVSYGWMQQMFGNTNLNTIDGMFANCHNLSMTSIGTILQFIKGLDVSRFNISSLNLSNKRSGSPFYNTNINLVNEEFLTELTIDGSFQRSEVEELAQRGWTF